MPKNQVNECYQLFEKSRKFLKANMTLYDILLLEEKEDFFENKLKEMNLKNFDFFVFSGWDHLMHIFVDYWFQHFADLKKNLKLGLLPIEYGNAINENMSYFYGFKPTI